MIDEFAECDTCRQKPGTPILCLPCQHNRALVAKLRTERNELLASLKAHFEEASIGICTRETLEETGKLIAKIEGKDGER